MTILWYKCFMLMFITLVSAYPFQRIVKETSRSGGNGPGVHVNQAAVKMNSTTGFRSLQQLYDGNQRFRNNVRMKARTMTEQEPGFMFIGCTDNRRSPSAIFNAPAGSILTHNNIGNVYSSRDASVTAAVAYAVESLRVQHIIVLGHYGCKGAESAITMPQNLNSLVKAWIKPITDLYFASRRVEIAKLRDSRKPHRGVPNGIKEAPPAHDAGFRALVEENVKRSVQELRDTSLLARSYSNPSKNNVDVFVHGFVYDEVTGDVRDLHLSFGPPGKPIPHIPFKSLEAAQNIQYNNYLPGINTGKVWDFSSPHR